MFGTRTITDDRGREVEFRAPGPPATGAAELAQLGSAPRSVSSSGCITILLGAGAILAVWMLVSESVEGFFSVVVVTCLLVAAVRLARGPSLTDVPLIDQRGRLDLAPWLLAEVCPGCGYSLAGLRPGADGVVECPECAAGWALARWHRDHPPFVTDPLAGMTFPRRCVSCTMKDARGRTVEAYPQELPPPARTMARRRMWAAFAVSAVLVAGVGGVMWWMGASWRAGAWVLGVLGGLLLLASMEVGRGELVRARWRMAKDELWGGSPRCVRCRADLPPTSAVSDGTVVCGRCGAAWALMRAEPTDAKNDQPR